MFGKPSIVKEYAGLIKQLENGERRPAQHVRPSRLDDQFKSFVTGGAEAIFEGFDFFAAVLNQHIANPWRIEETGDTHIRDFASDGPSLGRTYQIFYNGVQTGRLQVSDGTSVDGMAKVSTGTGKTGWRTSFLSSRTCASSPTTMHFPWYRP